MMRVSEEVDRGGFFGKARYLRSQSTDRLERLLGYGSGFLSHGWWLLFMLEKPDAEEFEYRGYTQMSGGVAQGHLANPPDRRTAEQRLKDDGFDMAALKAETVKNVFTLSGADRLAKVVPAVPGDDYPPGLGIPQWELKRGISKKFRVAAFIKPGETYLGDYT